MVTLCLYAKQLAPKIAIRHMKRTIMTMKAMNMLKVVARVFNAISNKLFYF